MPESQHYIPRFYLNEFTDPEVPQGQEPYLWIFKFESKKWERRAPVNVASKKDFYTLTDREGKKYNEIERALSALESKTALIFRDKIFKRNALLSEEKAVIAEFIAVMMTRIPKSHNRINTFVSKIVTLVMEMYQSRPEAVKELKKRYEKETGKKLPENLNETCFDPSKYEIRASKSFLLKAMISSINKITEALYYMNWTFLHSIENELFITSDNPVHMWHPKSKTSTYPHGLIHKHIEVTLPLSKQICFLASWNKEIRTHIDISQSDVEELNQRRIWASDKFIISSRNNFGGSKYLQYKLKPKDRK